MGNKVLLAHSGRIQFTLYCGNTGSFVLHRFSGLGKIVEVNQAADKVRRICARLAEESPQSPRAATYISELNAAARELAAQQTAWKKLSQRDQHQDEARQSYRSREKDSAEGFAEGLKLFTPKTPESEKKKD